MTNDLSRLRPRAAKQDRATSGRNLMFDRNSTDAPRRGYYQDMRNASRGDGGASELLHTLGLVREAAADVQQVQEARAAKQREVDSTDAATDFSTGRTDEARMLKSAAYKDATLSSRAQASISTMTPEIGRDARALIFKQSDPDLAKREAEVDALIDQRIRAFALDDEGSLKDFGSSKTKRLMAEQLGNLRQQLRSQAFAMIDERMGEESLTNMATTVTNNHRAAQHVDYDGALGLLLPMVDRQAGLATLVKAVKAAAVELEDTDPGRGRRILEDFYRWGKEQPATVSLNTEDEGMVAPASSPQHPLFNADQVLDLQDFRRTYGSRVTAKAERAREEVQAATSAGLLTRLAGVGAYPTPTEVRQRLRAGDLSPQQGIQLLNIIDGDRRQTVSDARQSASWADHARREGKEAYLKDRIGELLGPVYAGRSTITQANSRLLDVASRETDPEVRQALLREVGGELSSVQSLRLKGPEYQAADTNLNSWEETYAAQLQRVRLPRGMNAQSARALIRSKMDTFRTELGRGNWPSDKVGVFMKSAERRLDHWFTTTFPASRPTPLR